MTESDADLLRAKIKNKTAQVGVIGVDSVGWGKAGFAVTDIGVADFSSIARLDVVTVLAPASSPEAALNFIASACQGIARYCHSGLLVTVESAPYVGTIDEVVLPTLSKSGFVVGHDFFLCFSPALIRPDADTSRIVAGITAVCSEIGLLFYRQAFEIVETVISTNEAERLSLLESTSVETPRTIIHPKAQNHHGPAMQRETTLQVEGNRYKATTTLEADRYVSRGVTYVPFPLAAAAAQTTEKSLRDWIRKDIRFNGRPIRTHREPITGKLYVSEESIQRAVNRFVKWPSKDPAGAVTIGTTDDESGFLPMSDAAGILGISARTMWLWATHGKAPTEKPLDVVKCTTSDYFYVREKDVHDLKARVPRSGLQRGRRPHPALKT